MIDKLAWIEIKSKAILSTRTKGKETYYIPGGKREGTETDHQALIREIKEELNVDLIEEGLIFFGEFCAQAHGHPEGILVRMRCYTAPYIGSIKASSEIEEVRWLNHADKAIISEADKLIFDYAKEKGLLR